MTIKYQSHQGISISENISYTFYKEEDGLLYILEETSYDFKENDKAYRLFELKHQLDKNGKEYYELTVYGEILPHIILHKTEDIYKLDYINGILAYIETSTDLPSTHVPFHLRKTSREANEGNGRFSFKRGSDSLDQINESAEFGDNDELEEFKFSQINFKDTLLTVDKFQEGESQNYDSESEEILERGLAKQESDEISLIKKEVLDFDMKDCRANFPNINGINNEISSLKYISKDKLENSENLLSES